MARYLRENKPTNDNMLDSEPNLYLSVVGIVYIIFAIFGSFGNKGRAHLFSLYKS